jgi:hypothetical protein
MTAATIVTRLNELLSQVAAPAQLGQHARRFAALLSPTCELETVAPVVGELAKATLTIGSGLHRGAVIELVANEYVIGTDEECDIVLRDPSLEPRHVVLKRGWSGFTLHPLREEKSQPIAPQAVNYPGGAIEVVYDIGGVSLSLLQESAATEHPPHGRSRWLAGGIVAAVSVVTIFAFASQRGVTETPAPASSDSSRKTRDAQLLEQVRNTFAADDLRVALHDGRLRIAGTTEHLDVKQRVHALAEDLKGVIAIEDGVTYVDARERPAAPGPFPVKLRGVMVGDPSYFVTDAGARYFVGGVLPDGAEVLSIEATRISLRIDGRTAIYNLE